jgi:branched-chain amino acid transport system permease protein
VRTLTVGAVVVCGAFALAFPFLVNGYWLSVGVLAMFYAIVAASWALLAGYAGQFSFGHMAFVSLGAYTSGLLVKWFDIPIPLGMLAGVLMCGVVGSGIGLVCLRMRGPYLALFTVAFSEVLRIVIVSENEVTGGSGGLEVTPLFHGRTDSPYYYFGLALLLGSLAIMLFLVTSRWGLFFRAIRENEDAAAAAGVKVVRFRILAFAITSSFAGLAGGFYGHYIGILTPDIGSVDQMGLVVAMAVIGGAESIVAAMIGALGLEFLVEALRSYGQWRLVLFGALLLLTMRFARNGLLALAWQQFNAILPLPLRDVVGGKGQLGTGTASSPQPPTARGGGVS